MKSQPNALMNAFIWMFYVILDMCVCYENDNKQI